MTNWFYTVWGLGGLGLGGRGCEVLSGWWLSKKIVPAYAITITACNKLGLGLVWYFPGWG